MHDTTYCSPDTIDEAVAAMVAANGAGRILAGGTDLLVQMRAGMAKPGVIVDVKKIAEMTSIAEVAGSFRIGAADSVPALVAAAATVIIEGPRGRRDVAVETIHAGPGRTTLAPGEIVVAFALPARPPGSGDAYLRLIPRTEMDIAVVGCGVSLTIRNGTCVAARVALGAVAPTVLLVKEASRALIGSRLNDQALEAAAAACRAACKPIDDKRGTIHYRTKIAGVLLKRAAAIAAERAGAR